jgi:hypothetical protein
VAVSWPEAVVPRRGPRDDGRRLREAHRGRADHRLTSGMVHLLDGDATHMGTVAIGTLVRHSTTVQRSGIGGFEHDSEFGDGLVQREEGTWR